MHFEPGELFISYKFLEASNPKTLEAKMLQIQVSAGRPVNFTSPTYNSKTSKYETWYFHDYRKDIKPKEKLDLHNKVDL